ncbi:MAG: MFS transporter [Polyangiaceae bacterium]|nr:MFS transporter [Polyangiaceae bacterium]
MMSFLVLAVLIAGHTLLETARDALFLGKLPASSLSIVYASIALLALLVSTPNARFVKRFGERRALVITLLGAAFGTLVLYLMRPTPAVVFAVYVWSAFLGTVVVVQFWMFLAQLFTPSQGKRLFGPIAAGGVFGAVVGAGGAAAVLSFAPVRVLLLGGACLFLSCAFLSTTVDPERRLAGLAPDAPHFGNPNLITGAESKNHVAPPPESQSAVDSLLRTWKRFPYLTWVAILIGFATATVLSIDYLFKANAAEHVPKEQLGSFFARSYAAFNVTALIVQVIVAGPLVQRIGVARALIVMPLLLLTGATTALITGSNTAILITKGVDGSLRHSLHRLTLELLSLPVEAGVRARVKPRLEGALPRAVQATMAVIIFVLATTGFAGMRVIAGIIAFLSIGWLAAAFALREPHLNMFRQAIARGGLDLDAPIKLDPALRTALVDQLSARETLRAVAAIDLLREDMAGTHIPVSILKHPSDRVKVHALSVLSHAHRTDWVPYAKHLLESNQSEDVRVAAVRALAGVHAIDLLRPCISEPSAAVRAYAAVCISSAEPGDDSITPPLIQEILDAPGEAGRAGRIALLNAIFDTGHKRFAGVLLAMADESDPELMEHVVLAMTKVADRRFLPTLISRLHIRKTREAIRHALVDMGSPAQRAVEQALSTLATPPAVRLHLPRTLARFANQRAADFLTERLAKEPIHIVQYKTLRGLSQLSQSANVKIDQGLVIARIQQNLETYLEFTALLAVLETSAETQRSAGGRLVLGLIKDKAHQALDRAFLLLQTAYRREDIRGAFRALFGGDGRARSNALEFLDALTSGPGRAHAREIRGLIKVCVDDLPPMEKVERARAYMRDVPTNPEAALRKLIAGHDTALAALAVFHAEELGYHDIVEEAKGVALGRPSLAEMTTLLLGRPLQEQVDAP